VTAQVFGGSPLHVAVTGEPLDDGAFSKREFMNLGFLSSFEGEPESTLAISAALP
jgi:hypothetical protein